MEETVYNHEKKYQLPDSPDIEEKYRGRIVDYASYRRITGKCETCGAEMANHPKCGACGVLCGTGHLDWLPSSYRGQQLLGTA